MNISKFITRLVLMYIAISSINILIGADFKEMMNRGDAAYTDGNFTKAIDAYSQILKGGQTSAALEYNLGNAYFKVDQVGQSILHLERAYKLSPRDGDIQFNLNYVKLYRQDQLDLPARSVLVERFESFRKVFTGCELALTTLIFWIFLVVSFVIYWHGRGKRYGKQVFYIFLTATIMFILAGGWSLDRYRLDSQKQIVILETEVQIHSAPVESSKVLFVLHEGMEGTVKSQTDAWFEINLADGKTGWVQTNAVAQI